MKNFIKIKISTISLSIILAVIALSPYLSLAQATSDCNMPDGRTTTTTQANCVRAGGSWVQPQDSSTPPANSGGATCLPTGRPDIPYTTTGDELSPSCVPTQPDPNAVDINTGGAVPNNNPSSSASPANSSPGTTKGLVPCNNNSVPVVNSDGTTTPPVPCNFTTFMLLINKVVGFILFAMAVPIAAIMFAYAGFLLVTSGGSTEQKSKAKKIFTNVALGLIIAVAAWLIVHEILVIVGFQTDLFSL